MFVRLGRGVCVLAAGVGGFADDFRTVLVVEHAVIPMPRRRMLRDEGGRIGPLAAEVLPPTLCLPVAKQFGIGVFASGHFSSLRLPETQKRLGKDLFILAPAIFLVNKKCTKPQGPMRRYYLVCITADETAEGIASFSRRHAGDRWTAITI